MESTKKPSRLKELAYDLIEKSITEYLSDEENSKYFSDFGFTFQGVVGRGLGKESKKEGLIIEIFDDESKEVKHIVVDPTVKKECYNEDNIMIRQDYGTQVGAYDSNSDTKVSNKTKPAKTPVQSFEDIANAMSNKQVGDVNALAAEAGLN